MWAGKMVRTIKQNADRINCHQIRVELRTFYGVVTKMSNHAWIVPGDIVFQKGNPLTRLALLMCRCPGKMSEIAFQDYVIEALWWLIPSELAYDFRPRCIGNKSWSAIQSESSCFNPVWRSSVDWFLTAMAKALELPTNTTSCLPRVTAVYNRFR